jgi:hypothetical protein
MGFKRGRAWYGIQFGMYSIDACSKVNAVRTKNTKKHKRHKCKKCYFSTHTKIYSENPVQSFKLSVCLILQNCFGFQYNFFAQKLFFWNNNIGLVCYMKGVFHLLKICFKNGTLVFPLCLINSYNLTKPGCPVKWKTHDSIVQKQTKL